MVVILGHVAARAGLAWLTSGVSLAIVSRLCDAIKVSSWFSFRIVFPQPYGHRVGFASAMKFRAEQYYHASVERMRQARKICSDGDSFALSMYCAGLAVESLLRAFRWTDDSSFEGRHDLSELLKASGLLKFDGDYMRRRGASEEAIQQSALKIRVAMNQLSILWHNNLRYASESSASAFLRQAGKARGLKGNALKKNAGDLVEAAQTVIDRGVAIWTSKQRP